MFTPVFAFLVLLSFFFYILFYDFVLFPLIVVVQVAGKTLGSGRKTLKEY